MRILYSAGNRVGANSQLVRFLENLSDEHDVRIAAFTKSSQSLLHIDWTLDSLYNNIIHNKQSFELFELFGHKGVPLVNLESARVFVTEAIDFEPDLIISDGEVISAHIAKAANIELWYCSPLHLIDGMIWKDYTFKYTSLLDVPKKRLNKFPKADRTFIYSPFGDIENPPPLKKGYEWVSPYSISMDDESDLNYDNLVVVNELSRLNSLARIVNSSSRDIGLVSLFDETMFDVDTFNSEDYESYKEVLTHCNNIITTGETSYISDAIYNGKGIVTIPTLSDTESLLNSIMVSELGLGRDIGQVEFMDRFSLDVFDLSLSGSFDNKSVKNKSMFLHERLS